MSKSTKPVTKSKNLGYGRLLIAVYAIFALAATARAAYTLAVKFNDAPVAYILSAVSAVVYILATVALAKTGRNWTRIARIAVIFELVGVISVGTLSFTHPELFAHPSVWSGFGKGYGYVPAVLPLVGLYWLAKRDRA
jgi:hypothetical protein